MFAKMNASCVLDFAISTHQRFAFIHYYGIRTHLICGIGIIRERYEI